MRRHDDLATHNERTKMFATIFNAGGMAFFGLGVARPLIEGHWDRLFSIMFSLAISGIAFRVAYVVLGQLKTDDLEKETDE